MWNVKSCVGVWIISLTYNEEIKILNSGFSDEWKQILMSPANTSEINISEVSQNIKLFLFSSLQTGRTDEWERWRSQTCFFYVFTSHIFGSSWKDHQDNYKWMKQEPETSLRVNTYFPVFCIMVIIKTIPRNITTFQGCIDKRYIFTSTCLTSVF